LAKKEKKKKMRDSTSKDSSNEPKAIESKNCLLRVEDLASLICRFGCK
jgi:hypothetical protein